MSIRPVILFLGAFVLAASCRKAEDPSSERTYHFSVEAGAPLTRALSLQGDVLHASWSTTESVTVLKGENPVGTLHPATNGPTATLTGTLTGTFAVNDLLTLWFPGPTVDYSGQKGTLEDIASNYDFASATVRITEVSGDRITAVDSENGGAAQFGNRQAIVRFTLKDKNADGTPVIAASALTVLVEGAAAVVVKPESAASELYVALPGFSGKTVTLSATVGGRLYRYSKGGVSFGNGEFHVISVRMSALDDAIDLGLPSGTLWSSRNIGASNPQDAGAYFAWGETEGYASGHTFDWANYTHSGSEVNTLKKYNNASYYGPVVDNKSILEPVDDPAYNRRGPDWCLPTTAQVNELVDQTDKEWTTVDEKPGWRFTSKTNGHSIFIPAAGYYEGDTLVEGPSQGESAKGYYWLNEINTGTPTNARNLTFYKYSGEGYWWNSSPRYRGQSVRPVVRQ